MKTMIIADTNIAEIKIVTPQGVSKAQYSSPDAVLQQVSKYRNSGFSIVSISSGVYTLEVDDGWRTDVQK